MSLFSAVSSGISRVCSVIGSAFSSVGTGITSFATKLMTPFSNIELAIKAIILVAEIVIGVAELLGLKPESESAEELGAKAKDADLNREDFASTEAYIEYLRNEVAFDKEKFDKMSPEEKLACTTVGLSLYAKNIEEKVSVGLSPEFLLKASKLEMKAVEIKSYMDAFKDSGLTDMKFMSDYLVGKLDEKTDSKVGTAIVHALKSMNPNMSEKMIQSKLGEMTKESLRPEEN